MSRAHFAVSIKTIDAKPLFPSNFNGEGFLMMSTIQLVEKTGCVMKGFAGFPTGLELVLWCNDMEEARKFADELSNVLHEKTNSLNHIIESFAIHIGELLDDDRILDEFMMDMMLRSMAARVLDLSSLPLKSPKNSKSFS